MKFGWRQKSTKKGKDKQVENLEIHSKLNFVGDMNFHILCLF